MRMGQVNSLLVVFSKRMDSPIKAIILPRNIKEMSSKEELQLSKSSASYNQDKAKILAFLELAPLLIPFGSDREIQLSTMSKEGFDHYGPKYLTNLDWENHDHQRIVADCLIQAAYVFEADRKKGRRGGDQLAPPWWEFFGFELIQRLEDLEDHATDPLTIGAVFQLKAATGPSTSAPTSVIAIRGTVNLHDWCINMETFIGHGFQSHYYRVVMRALDTFSGGHGNESNLWLCGHSLGAAIATLVGERMAMQGSFFTTFLFNPPYFLNKRKDVAPTLPDVIMEMAGHLFNERVVSANLAINHAAHHVRDKRKTAQLQWFQNLNKWEPRVFVNSNDCLCGRYIKHFEEKIKGPPNKLPKRIASAILVINLDKPGSRLFHFREAHSIMQWWKEGLRVKATRYVA